MYNLGGSFVFLMIDLFWQGEMVRGSGCGLPCLYLAVPIYSVEMRFGHREAERRILSFYLATTRAQIDTV